MNDLAALGIVTLVWIIVVAIIVQFIIHPVVDLIGDIITKNNEVKEKTHRNTLIKDLQAQRDAREDEIKHLNKIINEERIKSNRRNNERTRAIEELDAQKKWNLVLSEENTRYIRIIDKRNEAIKDLLERGVYET